MMRRGTLRRCVRTRLNKADMGSPANIIWPKTANRYILTSDDSYAISGNTPHFFEVTEGGEVRDVFTPVREGSL